MILMQSRLLIPMDANANLPPHALADCSMLCLAFSASGAPDIVMYCLRSEKEDCCEMREQINQNAVRSKICE
jgi:hypothetical protein